MARHIFRVLSVDAIINDGRPSAAWLRFCPAAEQEIYFEMPRAIFERLRDQMSAELDRTKPPSPRDQSAPSARRRSK